MSALELNLPEAKYVVAVSGGIDSMVLLDLLINSNKSYKLIVAHFDHGIRSGSKKDRTFVEQKAKELGLEFEYKAGMLGPDASEEAARNARYKFLFSVMKKHGAKAVVTAHHQDDLIETAVINILRGTTARGLASLRNRSEVKRPLLDYPKTTLLKYAREKDLVWREDPSNTDKKYLRNYIRQEIAPKLSPAQRQELLKNIQSAGESVAQIDQQLDVLFGMNKENEKINRHQFIMLPHEVAKEFTAEWLRKNGVKNINSKMIERLVVAAKTYKPGRVADVNKNNKIKITLRKLELIGP